EWRDAIAAAFAPDAPAPEEVVTGCIDLLRAWSRSWTARPQVVIGLAADGRARLVDEVVAAIAGAGRLSSGSIGVAARPSPGLTSGDEAAHWRDALVMPADGEVPLVRRVVLLVVDATSSGWPVTIAAAALRDAGAAEVLPLVIHKRP
ncbi:MAG: ATP-dependent DNA helicase RecQ, partial [Thermoleophilia bacterium]